MSPFSVFLLNSVEINVNLRNCFFFLLLSKLGIKLIHDIVHSFFKPLWQFNFSKLSSNYIWNLSEPEWTFSWFFLAPFLHLLFKLSFQKKNISEILDLVYIAISSIYSYHLIHLLIEHYLLLSHILSANCFMFVRYPQALHVREIPTSVRGLLTSNGFSELESRPIRNKNILI